MCRLYLPGSTDDCHIRRASSGLNVAPYRDVWLSIQLGAGDWFRGGTVNWDVNGDYGPIARCNVDCAARFTHQCLDEPQTGTRVPGIRSESDTIVYSGQFPEILAGLGGRLLPQGELYKVCGSVGREGMLKTIFQEAVDNDRQWRGDGSGYVL